MKKQIAVACAVGAAFLVACAPDIPQEQPAAVVTARFDPSQAPPVVPTPNDLAQNPATGLLNVTPAPGASAADLEFVAWLNTLNGFPAGSSAAATFNGDLDTASVTTANVLVLDATNAYALVDGYTVTPVPVAATDAEDAKARISISPPAGGWSQGHVYAVAVLGGNHLKGAGGKPVVGSTTWALVRSEQSLVTCTDLTSPDCRAATELIPSAFTDPAQRIADQAAKAKQLEMLRRKYKPSVDAVIASGVTRSDIALLWTFKIAQAPIAGFNPSAVPPVVPTPNDLAIDRTTGLVNAPYEVGDGGVLSAQAEFTRDYLNTLDGFPITATGEAQIQAGPLEGTTVDATTVRFLDLTELAKGTAGVQPSVTISYDSVLDKIRIAPAAGTWVKGHQYAVALTTGMKDPAGHALAASDAFALARSANTLVDCDITTADPTTCHSVMLMAPITDAQAVALEGLRQGLKPVFDAFNALPGGAKLPRVNIALLWTFRTVSFPEATFDPAASVIPFPNNILLSPTTGKVNLPIPPGAPASQVALITGLNTLDGFSTVGPFVSENSATRAALDTGHIDPATLAAGTGFVPLQSGVSPPEVTACLNCEQSLLPDGGVPNNPEQLQFVTEAPLEERALYGAYMTRALHNTDDPAKPVAATGAFALAKLSASLVNPECVTLAEPDCRSMVSGVSDAQAKALEPLRRGLKSMFDGLSAMGVARKELVLAWGFKTQTNRTALEQIHDTAAAMGGAGALPATVKFAVDATAAIKAQMGSLPSSNIDKIFTGELTVPYLLTGPGTTLNPAAPAVQTIPFLVTIPVGTAPTNGWPVVLFGHGLASQKSTMLAFADSAAAHGEALIAADFPFHGDRAVCTGSRAATGQVTDDASCADPVNQMCGANGRCVARLDATRLLCDATTIGTGEPPDSYCSRQGQGICVAADDKCEGGDFLRGSDGKPVISGWNFLDTANLFATRDHFRAPVGDLAQWARVVKEATATTGSLNFYLNAQGASPLDGASIHYGGISLGGIIGTMYTAASPDAHRSLLNVAGADQTLVLLISPSFVNQRNAFLATLAAQGITPGTPQFDDFIGIARWILGPGDPQNAAYWMMNGIRKPSDRKVLLQYVKDDPTIPNASTAKLIAAANRTLPPLGTPIDLSFWDDTRLQNMSIGSRHGSLLNFAVPAVTAGLQTEAATFLQDGTVP